MPAVLWLQNMLRLLLLLLLLQTCTVSGKEDHEPHQASAQVSRLVWDCSLVWQQISCRCTVSVPVSAELM
jgi:hypothetical protein